VIHRIWVLWTLVAILSAAAPTTSVLAQQPPQTESARDPAQADEAAPAPPDDAVAEDDPWGFEDEEEEIEPGWGEAIRSQAQDLILLTAFLALAMVSFFRKSIPLKYVTFGFAILYLGLVKSQLITVVNVYSLMIWNLPIVKFNLAFYVFGVFTLVSTVLWGRVYCGRVCAYGALTQALDRIVPAKLRLEIPARIEQRANYIKYALLAGTLAYFLVTADISKYRYVEPFWMFTLQSSSTALWIAIGVLLLATVFVRNLYCRFLCPVGAFLGILSNLTVFRIKRWSECNTCKICEKTCEWGAIRGPKIVASECVRCDDCERLYMDKKKCPHWIIIQRKGDVLARQAAAATAAATVGLNPGAA